MFRKIINTGNDYSAFILRVALGVVLMAHGLQKAFGWFNGFGWNNTINYFTGTVGIPALLGAFVILIETLGAFLLILGFAGRINAVLMGIVITGAMVVDHAQNGFYMNWFGVQKGEGIEFDLLFLAISVASAIKGSGSFSIDKWLLQFKKNKEMNISGKTLYRPDKVFS
ncbi:DoxX family protein [Panacibacter ginsenosidivorans]|uniref:DoxX family protein n=1 Tax=Panacibacter ginsenosidivorans TaxID=1813871 RepID=A0A5B8V927_9BACT|nr:DoxX family protein [Panacibacter ginsenosidivorans]QEC67852.1 DoxX family protein [Panacibacter ginsenosidivorans]